MSKEELIFASENEALQHLANMTGKRIMIAFVDPEEVTPWDEEEHERMMNTIDYTIEKAIEDLKGSELSLDEVVSHAMDFMGGRDFDHKLPKEILKIPKRKDELQYLSLKSMKYPSKEWKEIISIQEKQEEKSKATPEFKKIKEEYLNLLKELGKTDLSHAGSFKLSKEEKKRIREMRKRLKEISDTVWDKFGLNIFSLVKDQTKFMSEPSLP
jgi:hypothetical protein